LKKPQEVIDWKMSKKSESVEKDIEEFDEREIDTYLPDEAEEYNGTANSVVIGEAEEVELEPGEDEEEIYPDDFAPLWKPAEPGESLTGTVLAKFDSLYGLALKIKTEDGAEYQTPAHQSLIKRIAKVEPGDFIRIVYQGRVRTSKGMLAASYRVFRADKKQKKIGTENGLKLPESGSAGEGEQR